MGLMREIKETWNGSLSPFRLSEVTPYFWEGSQSEHLLRTRFVQRKTHASCGDHVREEAQLLWLRHEAVGLEPRTHVPSRAWGGFDECTGYKNKKRHRNGVFLFLVTRTGIEPMLQP